MEVAGTVAAVLAALITTPKVKKPNKTCPLCGIANRREFYSCRRCGHLFFDQTKQDVQDPSTRR